MTGIADLYLYLKKPHSKERRKRLLAHLYKADPHTRFVVLSWKRTGSNMLCGMLHLHPEIVMHNELFNPIDIFTYHPSFKVGVDKKPIWTVLTRDLFPEQFLDFVWTGRKADKTFIKQDFRAVGFKSFPEHWLDVRNEPFFQNNILEDLRVKKIILMREDELAVFVSMKRADYTGSYMTNAYPKDLTFRIDPAEFQRFLNNYRNTFRNKYRSPIAKRDTFWITYEQLIDTKVFETTILPRLWDFLGVKNDIPMRLLRETVKQADPDEDLSTVIENYGELEFCFRHSEVLHFQKRRERALKDGDISAKAGEKTDTTTPAKSLPKDSSWSILLPICSRPKTSQAPPHHNVEKIKDQFNSNRFIELAVSSQHNPNAAIDEDVCWKMLEDFCESLADTCSAAQLRQTECVVGIDIDDPVFQTPSARSRITQILPCAAVFVDIQPTLYGQVCKIWNLLGRKSKNDYVVLLGDDIKLLDVGWQDRIVAKFHDIARSQGLPLGAAVVAMKDLAFPGFPTFPVVHRWHIEHFGAILPKQFANQGGDPYLFELYSRYQAAAFEVTCRLENAIGGDGDARYEKHQINWRGQILSLNLRHLTRFLDDRKPFGLCLDVVVPSYRTDNDEFLRRIISLRSTVPMYVKFWLVVDNPREEHVDAMKRLADEANQAQLDKDCNYFTYVIHYAENRGASYARNTGYNYTTADWVLFLDDDVIPDEHILDAYAGAILRYPEAKVFVGLTELPDARNLWTEMLRACNVGFFYAIAKRMVHPSWGVTANLMVRGSRFNSTIQFKYMFPKTGGGEDIDFVYQFKEWYKPLGRAVTVGVPEAKARHPWWNKGQPCYKQIMGWAWGDSLCITEWSQKTFLTCPNWIEYTAFVVPLLSVYTGRFLAGVLAGCSVVLVEHMIKCASYYSDSKAVAKGGIWRNLLVALGAGSILSSQEITRVAALVRRGSLYSLCRRVDWFDGEEPRIKLDIQLTSLVRLGLNVGLTAAIFAWPWGGRKR